MTENKSKNLSSEGPLSPFHIEVNRIKRGISLVASGVIGINDFGEDRAVLMTHGGRIIISGDRLTVLIYEHNTVEISGKISEVGFTYGKN
ncbi:MAG: YabP/YqfC family sporulation protein [Clostridia bacterium]|nr:YabP/YqfC family sporulation protein [Clostridia bacterium]